MSELYESKNLYTRRRKDKMYGLYSRILFRKGEHILDIRLSDKQEERDYRSIELQDGHYLHPDGMFTNHSCDPTAYVDKATGFLIATKNIWPNDEITFNYLESETEIVSSFDCGCGAENCFGKIEK